MQRIYFTRHGYARNKEPHEVTVDGFAELEQVRTKLAALGFRATVGISSTERRAVETSRFLSYGVEPMCLEILHTYGGFESLGVVMRNGRGVSWKDAQAYTERMLRATLRLVPKDGCAVVSGHDHIPFMLALRYAQINGAETVWNYLGEDIGFPNQGEGVLVSGKDMHYFFNKE